MSHFVALRGDFCDLLPHVHSVHHTLDEAKAAIEQFNTTKQFKGFKLDKWRKTKRGFWTGTFVDTNEMYEASECYIQETKE